MFASLSPSAQVFFIIVPVFVAILAALGRHPHIEPEHARALAMAAGAMTQAARYAVRGKIPSARRAATIGAVLNVTPRSLEQAFNGSRGVAWGMRQFLNLTSKQFSEPRDEPVLRELNRFVRLARRLHRRPPLESALRRELERIGTLDACEHDASLQATMGWLVHQLGEREDAKGDRALAWMYGLRVAWLWRSLGGRRSPVCYVPRAVTRAAHSAIHDVSLR